MLIGITIDMTSDRLRAGISGKDLLLDEPNAVVIRPIRRGRMLVAVGRDAEQATDAESVVAAYRPDSFDPELTTSVVNYLSLAMWSQLRSFPRGIFDRLEVRLVLADYERIPEDRRALFERRLAALSRNPRRRRKWIINGSPV